MNLKLVVVAGATGKLGRLIVNALLTNPEVRVRALVREVKKPESLALAGPRVELVRFDATSASEAERRAAVESAFAVVSAMQGGPEIIIDAQLGLMAAAKAAGARRFIPSDYSYNYFTLPAGINVNSDWRRTFAQKASPEVGAKFEVVHVMQGIFADAGVLGFLGVLDPATRTARYWGDGTAPIDWATWEDTARYTAAAAVSNEPLPQQLFVSGDRQNIMSFAKTWEAAHGQALKLERLGSLEDLERETARRFSTEPQNMYGWLPLMYARGVFGGQALLGPSHNARFPTIVPETLAQAMKRGAL